MIGILIVAHDTFGESLVRAVTHVLGSRPPQFESFRVSASDDPFALLPKARDLVQRARQLLPLIGEVEPEAVRIAIRPIPGDHLSAIGPVPRTSGYYLAVTHSGVTMSPFLGAAVADEVVRGKQRRELADFRPARFFN